MTDGNLAFPIDTEVDGNPIVGEISLSLRAKDGAPVLAMVRALPHFLFIFTRGGAMRTLSFEISRGRRHPSKRHLVAGNR